MKASPHKKAFTLIEILVVVAIIALLVAIFLPSLRRARDNAKRVQCAAQLKEISNSTQLFLYDTKGYLPPAIGPVSHACAANFSSLGRIFPKEVAEHDHHWRSPRIPVGRGPYPRPLNRYLGFKNHRPYTEVPIAHCPLDKKTTSRGELEILESMYEREGTSYWFNMNGDTPFGGYGEWLRESGLLIDEQLMNGPDFLARNITMHASRFVVAGDAAPFIQLLNDGQPNSEYRIVGRWHEGRPGLKWLHGNVMFLDGHVGYRVYDIANNKHKNPVAARYIFPDFSLYPYLRRFPDE
ncbi:MAG: type II secretion system protein [Planctomycetota bacterium]|jgi:prepilin-type N-terminal cleavage/methylation domain-containing protein/prepilin-type processing-associated H-X9-DG protein